MHSCDAYPTRNACRAVPKNAWNVLVFIAAFKENDVGGSRRRKKGQEKTGMQEDKLRVGVFGCGSMGAALVTRLLQVKEAGGPVSGVVAWNRTFDKTAPLAEKGATVLILFVSIVDIQ